MGHKGKKTWLWRTGRGLSEKLGCRDHLNELILNARTQVESLKFKLFRRSFDRDHLGDKITVVVFAVDPSPLLPACLKAIEAQTVRPKSIEVVRNVCPVSKACQVGLEKVDTPYYVSVDEDMVLDPDAIERLYYLMQSDNNCAESIARLEDPYMGKIYGVRMYRTEAVRPIGFIDLKDQKAWDRSMSKSLIEAGHAKRQSGAVIGSHHPVYLPHEAYWKFRFSGEKIKYYGDRYTPRFAETVDRLVSAWRQGGDEVALYALAGLFEGIKSEGVGGELTYEGRIEDPVFKRVESFVEMLKRE